MSTGPAAAPGTKARRIAPEGARGNLRPSGARGDRHEDGGERHLAQVLPQSGGNVRLAAPKADRVDEGEDGVHGDVDFLAAEVVAHLADDVGPDAERFAPLDAQGF